MEQLTTYQALALRFGVSVCTIYRRLKPYTHELVRLSKRTVRVPESLVQKIIIKNALHPKGKNLKTPTRSR